MQLINAVIECNDKIVLSNLVVMDKCAYVWLSLNGSEPNLSNLVAAIETNFGVLSTSLIAVGEENGASIAQRLAKRFKIQVLLADTLPELDVEDMRIVEKRLVEELTKALNI
mmetsp:Transcript_14522/g.25571  ORF Transcript_14522/g.25571 Transcript_14522/m.25571 type:complete len:112 (-) Transcript_14522:134-469(-)|eukprot:CAMPEP_0185002248 /NCGR_PEP_ID=MMETSP1098-20130426/73383_1 /TAXON_ID=89044 /ORGANISM="Spumella elongata, Strain CCAP 955/1" /LENGTH=111 /DNA_ID=CAMNT_0027529715 /DNA_START=16 /DNA_END=351 /DNA_ORIENTATION=+